MFDELYSPTNTIVSGEEKLHLVFQVYMKNHVHSILAERRERTQNHPHCMCMCDHVDPVITTVYYLKAGVRQRESMLDRR